MSEAFQAAGRRILTVLPVLFLSLVPAVLSSGGTDNPHAFMSDGRKCIKCHEKVPEEGDDYTTLVMTKDIVTLCEECHPDMVNSDKHPVDIRPDVQVPRELHLDNYYSITCVTCHDPHGDPMADDPYVPYTTLNKVVRFLEGESRYPTFFLRISNSRGELCYTCHTDEALTSAEEPYLLDVEDHYVGSERCRECHPEDYMEWEKSLHARFVGDARRELNRIQAVFEADEPFPPGEILYTLGEHWTQRYVVEGKKGPMVRPDIWSIQTREWISTGRYSRSWYRYCVGCHTTGFNPFKNTFVETGIGCEACHGPGKLHTETTDQFDITNPAKLIPKRRDMVCESCHTNGHDRSGSYRFPVGYRPGEDLMKYFKGLVPRPGQDTDSYTGDGTYEDRHRQYLFWFTRYNLAQGIVCDVCKNLRPQEDVDTEEGVYLTSSELCSTCHPWYWENFTGHARHDPEQVGCIECHPPRLARGGTGYQIHDHKFQFEEPVYQDNLTMEERCQACHGEEAVFSRKAFSGRK